MDITYVLVFTMRQGRDTFQNFNLFSLLQYSPLIDNENFDYVHHMLVYICAGLNEAEVNDSAPCRGGVGVSLSACLAGEVLAGWAVGGEVSNMLILVDLLCYQQEIESIDL